MTKSKTQKFISYFAMILLAVFARLIPHSPNFTPIGGLAIFSGLQFKSKLSVLIPLLAMVISDMFLGIHKTIPYVYISFIIIFFLGRSIKNEITFKKIVIISLVSSILFFLITNLGVFITGSMYQKSFSGLIQCYFMGIPFFRNTAISDIFYSLTFFYGYKYLPLIIPKKLFRSKL